MELEARMKRGAVIITVVAVALLAMAMDAGAQLAGPALTVEESRIDLGDIQAGTDAVATFVFHNAGPVDVRILNAKPS
jgi:hypothetical protein